MSKRLIFTLTYLLVYLFLFLNVVTAYAIDGPAYVDYLDSIRQYVFIVFIVYSMVINVLLVRKHARYKRVEIKRIYLNILYFCTPIAISLLWTWQASYYRSIIDQGHFLNFHIGFLLSVLLMVMYFCLGLYLILKNYSFRINVSK